MNASLRPQLANGLHWVRGELEQSITRARSLIEQYIENDAEPLPLQQAYVELHTVRGTSAMIQCHGAAALAEEMKSALHDLTHKRIAEPEALYAALLAGTIQLNDYLLALSDGADDCVLVLQPAINELRLTRSQPVLTEAELFTQQMLALGVQLPLPEDHSGLQGAAQQQARKLLPLFQASLLAWIRNAQDARTGLGRIGKIAEHIAQQAQTVPVHQLWRVMAAMVESLLGNTLEDSIDLKRLVGRSGAQLKLLAEQGEDAATAGGALELSLQLLFLIARSRAQGPRALALRRGFQLNIYLPSQAQVEENRRKIHGPSTSLLARVSEEIRSEFAKVKDRIDLAVRTGGAGADFSDTRDSLKRISDTLAALGLTVLQRVVANQAAALETAGEASGAGVWMEIATSILRVENSLENALYFQLRRPRDVDQRDELEVKVPASRDLSDGMSALYRESLVNLARVKAAVDAYIKSGVATELPDSVLLLDEIASGFDILGSTRAGSLLRQLRGFLSGASFPTLRESHERADRFADTVACVEYYVEAARDQLPSADGILDDLARYLDQLIGDSATAAHADAFSLADFDLPLEPGQAPAPAGESAPPTATPATPAPPAVVAAGDDDPEIREIFLEEAGEVLAALEGALPSWTRDPQNRDAMVTIRRAFHTLKGSGRTVGARDIGEFGWGLESMLNRCLDGSIASSAGVVTTVSDAVAQLPALIEAFRDRKPAPPAIAELMARAREYSEGRDPAAAAEPDMVAIFREDAQEKIAMIGAWLAHLDRALPEQRTDAEIKRAFHTLRGAARVVDASAVAELASAAETYLDALDEAHAPINVAGLGLLDEVATTLAQWIEAVGTRSAQAQDPSLLVGRFQDLQAHLPSIVGNNGVDRELVEIFCAEAFDLVQRMEETLRGWMQTPDNHRAPQDLKIIYHTLKGAALMAECPAIGNVARALHERMDECILSGAVPDAAAFAELNQISEILYQQLDAFREGRLSGEGEELVARVKALRWSSPAASSLASPAATSSAEMPPPVAPIEVVEMPPVAADAAPTPIALDEAPIEIPPVSMEALSDPLALETAPIEMPAVEMPPVEIPPVAMEASIDELSLDLNDPFADTPAAVANEAPAPAVTDMPASMALAAELAPTFEAPTEMPPVAEAADDPEMLAIFIAEAEELLESLDQSLSALERDPHNRRASQELLRVLHTLKGSARVAGMTQIGDVVHGMESQIEAVERGRALADSAFFSRLQNANDGLHLALDDLKRGVIPDVGALVEELSTSPSAASDAASASARSEMPAPIFIPTPTPAAPAYSAPAAALDADLVEVFTGEAVELMDQLEQALANWQLAPADLAPSQDMQRALHTLKGGARMSGLVAMGDAAHDLETLLSRIDLAGKADAAALQPVAAAVVGLRAMTDRLERRDYAAAADAAPVDASSAPEASPPLEPVGADDAGGVALPEEQAVSEETAPSGIWGADLFWRPAEESEHLIALRRETARVPVEALDRMLNEAGEISIYRSRLEEHNSATQTQLDEMAQAIQRIREQMRQMQSETDAQIAARGLIQSEGSDRYAGEFDPLEMDRYTRMQELSRALNESISDLAAVHASMDELTSEAVTILLQQGRINTEIQQGMMRTLMVPFSRQAARLQRVVQQTSLENGKRAEVQFSGIEAELDRNVLERMTAPLEHLLRNAVVHGIEMPDARSFAGKDPVGRITVSLWREGTQLFIELRDDGRGLDFHAIRETAIRRGLMPADAQVSDEEAAQFIFMPGFSTAKQLTQDAGRGVGMDVVAAEVKQLGGTLELASEPGKGARFLVRLPLTLALSQALLIGVGHEQYAVPLGSIEGIARIPSEDLDRLYASDGADFRYGDREYRVRSLGEFIGVPRDAASEPKTLNAILVRLPEGLGAGERRIAMVVDALIGNREVVSKTLGPQVSAIPGVTGGTILADGRVVLILDVAALAQDRTRRALRSLVGTGAAVEDTTTVQNNLVMVVDDSITIRRVTERLLLKHGYRVVTAKDGLDAMAQLQTESPAAILLDIEMPRADGFEVATFVRNSQRIAATPIIMITSRSGEKHRERARSIGVNRYLIKPYLEDQLMEELRSVLGRDEEAGA
ncbi:MAG TPA: Hpt domain-containing protein [Solimonas sp.]